MGRGRAAGRYCSPDDWPHGPHTTQGYTFYQLLKEVSGVAFHGTKAEYDKALAAVRAGVATKAQEAAVAREAQQAGSRGNAARAALQGQ